MDWRENASTVGAPPTVRGSPSRRRLLALLGGLPTLQQAVAGVGIPPLSTDDRGSNIAAIPQLFAAFQALLERHEAALATCDRIEAALLAQMDHPQVPLPPDWDGSYRYARDAGAIARVVSSNRRRRHLQRLLQRQQRRWDEAARTAGLTAALLSEASLDEAVLDTADGLLATPASTLDAVVLKLIVLLSTRDPGPHASTTSPWRELRLILVDLRGLAGQDGGGS